MARIVVVEDNETISNLMQAILELEDHVVHTCKDSTCLHRVLHDQRDPPDLIFLDVFLQGEDGRQICHQLKQDAHTQHIPIILCSAFISSNEALEKSRADDFLLKPFHIDELLTRAQKYSANRNFEGE